MSEQISMSDLLLGQSNLFTAPPKIKQRIESAGIFSRCPLCGAKFSKHGEILSYDSNSETVKIYCDGCHTKIDIINVTYPESLDVWKNPYREEGFLK